MIGGFGGGTYRPPTVAGAAPSKYDPAYGGVPQVANPVATADQAITGNIGNIGDITNLTAQIDALNQRQLQSNYNMAIPDYAGLTHQSSRLASQELSGKVPDDVISQLLQQAAERGIMTGGAGSPNTNAAYLHALGLTSLGIEQTGMQNLHQITADAPIAPLFDPSKLIVSPEQQQAAQQASNTMASAPDPKAAAQAAIGAATPSSNLPWWAQAAGQPTNLGTGSYLNGGVWHTPRGAGG